MNFMLKPCLLKNQHQPRAEDFQLRPDVVEMPAASSFVLMLLRCQLHAEDFQLRVDVVMPASC
jgi:hypothetical protein